MPIGSSGWGQPGTALNSAGGNLLESGVPTEGGGASQVTPFAAGDSDGYPLGRT